MKNGTGKTYLFGYFSRSVSVLFIAYFLSFTNFTDKKIRPTFVFIETSQLIFSASQWTGLYMKGI